MPLAVPEELKKKVRSVLISNPKGVEIFRFTKDFRSLLGEPLDFRGSGFSSLTDFLQAIPDVVRMEYSAKSKTHKLHGVTDSSLFLPSALKKGTRTKLKEVKGVQNAPATEIPQRMEWEMQMEPNKKGQYAICFPKLPRYTREDVGDDFSRVGEVAEISFTHSYVFVRYNSKIEALNAMEQFHDTYNVKIPTEMKSTPYLLPRRGMQSKGKPNSPATQAEASTGADELVEVYVAGFPEGFPENEILKKLGDISVYRCHAVNTQTKSFMFVQVKKEDVERVVSLLHKSVLQGHQLVCKLSHKYNVSCNNDSEKSSSHLTNLLDKCHTGHLVALTDLEYEQKSSSTESLTRSDEDEAGMDSKAQSLTSPVYLDDMPPLEPVDLDDMGPPPLEPVQTDGPGEVSQNRGPQNIRTDNVLLNSRKNMHGRTTLSNEALLGEYPTPQFQPFPVAQPGHSLICQSTSLQCQDMDRKSRRVVYNAQAAAKQWNGCVSHGNKRNRTESGIEDKLIGWPEGTQIVTVSNFPYHTTWSELLEVFEECGALRVVMINNQPPQKSVALVYVCDTECANAMVELHHCELFGRLLKVKWKEASFPIENHHPTMENLVCTVDVSLDDSLSRRVIKTSDQLDRPTLPVHQVQPLKEDLVEECMEGNFNHWDPNFAAVDEDTAEDRLFMLVRQATLACCPGCRPWMPADLGTTKVEMVLSFIIANTHVWAQIKSDATESELRWLVQTTYDLRNEAIFLPYVRGSQTCAAQYGGAWYRGWVQIVRNNMATIFFLDYGNTEKVPVSSLRNLPKEYWQCRPQAWPIRVVSSTFSDLHNLEAQKVTARVLNHDQQEGLLHVRITGLPKPLA